MKWRNTVDYWRSIKKYKKYLEDVVTPLVRLSFPRISSLQRIFDIRFNLIFVSWLSTGSENSVTALGIHGNTRFFLLIALLKVYRARCNTETAFGDDIDLLACNLSSRHSVSIVVVLSLFLRNWIQTFSILFCIWDDIWGCIAHSSICKSRIVPFLSDVANVAVNLLPVFCLELHSQHLMNFECQVRGFVIPNYKRIRIEFSIGYGNPVLLNIAQLFLSFSFLDAYQDEYLSKYVTWVTNSWLTWQTLIRL